MQNHYNLLYREEEREMLPLCRSEGIGVIPWSPLARGALAGNRRAADDLTVRGRTDQQVAKLYGEDRDGAVVAAVRDVAARLGRPMAQVAYAWVASRPGITAPIVGISKPEQFADAIAALDFALDDESVARMTEPYRPKAVAGHI
jgi:aryl-alcohol dehydrogenase-like predicted oxidoreductase